MNRSNETSGVAHAADIAVASAAVNKHVDDYIKQMLAELSNMARDNGLAESARFIDAALLIILNQNLEPLATEAVKADETVDSFLS